MVILNKYNQLLNELSKIEGGFLSIPIDEESIFRLAIDKDLNPTILISEAMFDNTGKAKTNYRLDKLELEFNVMCNVKDIQTKKEINAPFTIIKQVNGNSRMHDYFLRVIDGMIYELIKDLSIKALNGEIEYLIQLFSSTKKIDEKVILGLWGELLYILSSSDIQSTIQAWHLDKDNLFDFSYAEVSVEVKTTTKSKRIHEFNNDQIKKYKRMKVNIVSIITEKVSLGKSIMDLWNEINLACLNNESRGKVARIISETVSQDLNALSQIKYNINMAESTLRTVNSSLIPSIKEEHINIGIEEVRLKINLDMLKV